MMNSFGRNCHVSIIIYLTGNLVILNLFLLCGIKSLI